MASTLKSFTVRVDYADYQELVKLAATHKPRLSKNYLVQVAIQRLLDLARNGQLELDFPQNLSRSA